jgi:hypothetical protein
VLVVDDREVEPRMSKPRHDGRLADLDNHRADDRLPRNELFAQEASRYWV